MNGNIYVFWWKLKDGQGNFGDELNNYLIAKLSDSKIIRIIIPLSGMSYINYSIRAVYHRQYTLKETATIVKQFFIKNFITGIGSIISQVNSKSCKVWGSGILNKNDIIRPAIFTAVRGKYTQKRLRELNLPAPDILGDPAVLLPIIYSPKNSKKYKIGIIPHIKHYKSVNEKTSDNNVIVINLTDYIEDIVDQINSCEYTISTSLHGLIVSHAYNVPSLWYYYEGIRLPGDDIKFYDYFSSVCIEEYNPIKFPEEISVHDIIEKFKEYSRHSRIQGSIRDMQNNLIKAAPFEILSRYRINN